MEDYGEGKPSCYLHPREVIVGICALCLKERLLLLASKQGHLPPKDAIKSFRVSRKKSIISLPKVFALGSYLHLLEFRNQKRKDDDSDDDSVASLEDSFISIQFEDGRSMWDCKKEGCLKLSSESSDGASTYNRGSMHVRGITTTMVEHAKTSGTLRWCKRIGHLLQLARRKRSNKASSSHVGMVSKMDAAVKGKKGWIRSLTRRRTTN